MDSATPSNHLQQQQNAQKRPINHSQSEQLFHSSRYGEATPLYNQHGSKNDIHIVQQQPLVNNLKPQLSPKYLQAASVKLSGNSGTRPPSGLATHNHQGQNSKQQNMHQKTQNANVMGFINNPLNNQQHPSLEKRPSFQLSPQAQVHSARQNFLSPQQQAIQQLMHSTITQDSTLANKSKQKATKKVNLMSQQSGFSIKQQSSQSQQLQQMQIQQQLQNPIKLNQQPITTSSNYSKEASISSSIKHSKSSLTSRVVQSDQEPFKSSNYHSNPVDKLDPSSLQALKGQLQAQNPQSFSFNRSGVQTSQSQRNQYNYQQTESDKINQNLQKNHEINQGQNKSLIAVNKRLKEINNQNQEQYQQSSVSSLLKPSSHNLKEQLSLLKDQNDSQVAYMLEQRLSHDPAQMKLSISQSKREFSPSQLHKLDVSQNQKLPFSRMSLESQAIQQNDSGQHKRNEQLHYQMFLDSNINNMQSNNIESHQSLASPLQRQKQVQSTNSIRNDDSSRLSITQSQLQTARPRTNQSNLQKQSTTCQAFSSTNSESTLLQQHQSNHKKSLKTRYLKQKEISSQMIESQLMNKSRNNTSKLLTRLASEMIIQHPTVSFQNLDPQQKTHEDFTQENQQQITKKSRISVNNLYKTLNQNQQTLQNNNQLIQANQNKASKIIAENDNEIDMNLQYSPIQKQIYFKNIDSSLAKRQSADFDKSKNVSREHIQRQAQEFFGKTYQEQQLHEQKSSSLYNSQTRRENKDSFTKQNSLHEEIYQGQIQHSPGSKFVEEITNINRQSKIRTLLQGQQDGKRSQSENPRLENQLSQVQQNINDIGVNSVHQSKYNYYQALVIQNKKQKQKNLEGKCLSARTMSVQSAGLVKNMNKQASALSLQSILPNHEPPKQSNKRNGIVRAYAASTNQGIYRSYNEDRVSIILNIVRPSNKRKKKNGNADTPTRWPTCSFFGVFDGHGGHLCADFLRDNLHHYIVRDENFPQNPREAIKRGFAEAEKFFIEYAMSVNLQEGQNTPTQDDIDKSGSCGIITLIVDDMVYVANVGDSRAILSANSGQKIYCLSRDHKPGDPSEKQRIIDHGGKIYQSQIPVKIPMLNNGSILNKQVQQHQLGPMRVFPGRLSVSRTFGDIEAKLRQFGGVPNVISAEPDIRQFKLSLSEHDFIIMGCDGIFDKLSNKEIIDLVWADINRKLEENEQKIIAEEQKAEQVKISLDSHQECSEAVELILQESVKKKTLDNITVVMICFKNFAKELKFGKAPLLDMTTPQEDIKDQRNKIEYREHPRQVQTEALNSAATSRQQSEDSLKSKLTITTDTPNQNSLKQQSSNSSSQMNYFILSKGKLTARNSKESEKYDSTSQNNFQKLQIDKVLQKYDSKIQYSAAITARSGLNTNQASSNIDIQKKTLLFKKSIDEQKQKNLYQMLKQKQLNEGMKGQNSKKASMFDIQEKQATDLRKEGPFKSSTESESKGKQTLLLKNYPTINSSRSTNSNGSAKDYSTNLVVTPDKRDSLNLVKSSTLQKQQSQQSNSHYSNRNMFSPKFTSQIGGQGIGVQNYSSTSSDSKHYDASTHKSQIQRQQSDRQFLKKSLKLK